MAPNLLQITIVYSSVNVASVLCQHVANRSSFGLTEIKVATLTPSFVNFVGCLRSALASSRPEP